MKTRENIIAESTRPEHKDTHRIMVAGNGACPSQNAKLARASQGAFYGEKQSHNFAFESEGPCQRSDRAELTCHFRVVRWAPIITEYRTNNMAVRIGDENLLEGAVNFWKEHTSL